MFKNKKVLSLWYKFIFLFVPGYWAVDEDDEYIVALYFKTFKGNIYIAKEIRHKKTED